MTIVHCKERLDVVRARGPRVSVSSFVMNEGTKALFDVLSRRFNPEDIVFAVFVAMKQAEIKESKRMSR